MSELFERDGGSIRDPTGQVFHSGDRIFRTLSEQGAKFVTQIYADKFANLVSSGLLIRGELISIPAQLASPDVAAVIEHPKLPIVCYPYEMTFSALKAAALHHLRFHRTLLAANFDLSDATAYNIQFLGTTPVFIDPTSIIAWRPNPWRGYRQFCRQFLYPLMMTAHGNCNFHSFYRGQIDGIDEAILLAMLPLHQSLKPSVILHARLPRWLKNHAQKGARPRVPLTSKAIFDEILAGLERLVRRLAPGSSVPRVWRKYMDSPPYHLRQMELKRSFVAHWMGAWKPRRLLDLGCNTGEFSSLALAAGAEYCIGVESDGASADTAFLRSDKERQKFLPLVIDLLDPSPARGWGGSERKSFLDRAKPDCVIALALVHHVAVTGIRLEEIVSGILAMAPRGLLEFVPESDPMVQRMLNDRGIVFQGYSEEVFVSQLKRLARIVGECEISPGGRKLWAFERL